MSVLIVCLIAFAVGWLLGAVQMALATMSADIDHEHETRRR